MNHNDHPINWVPATDAPKGRFSRPEDGEIVNVLDEDGRICRAISHFVDGVLELRDRHEEPLGPEGHWWSRALPVNPNRRRDAHQHKQNQMGSDFNGEFSGHANGQKEK